MTVEGMIHYRGGYFDKKDLYSVDDRHEWCTGFSNRAKLKLVEEDLLNLDKELSKLAVAREQLNASLKANSLNGQNLTLLSNIRSFKEIDVIDTKRFIKCFLRICFLLLLALDSPVTDNHRINCFTAYM